VDRRKSGSIRLQQAAFPSDLTDQEWSLIRPLIPLAKRGGNKRTIVERAVVDGLMYILSTGCQWLALPHSPKDLPPRSTVNDYFRRWSEDGTLDRIHHTLYVQCRELAGRKASPTAAIIDSQSVKSAVPQSIHMGMTRARRSRARSAISPSTRRVCC
jgi:transposase